MRHALKAGMNKKKCRSGIVSGTAFLSLARAGMKEHRAFIKPYCFWQHCWGNEKRTASRNCDAVRFSLVQIQLFVIPGPAYHPNT